LGNDIQLLEINPGAFTMAFDSLGVRHVPVASKVHFDFKPRFGLTSDIRLKPSVVAISGDRNSIENIDTIYTVPKYLKSQDASVSFEIALEIPPLITVEPRYIILSAPIDEFTEKNFRVPVWIEHQPDKVRVRLFPHEVDVRFSVGLASFPHVKSEDFSLYVSWNDIVNKAPVLKVKVKKQPDSVKSLMITPENVEYLIEKN
jgi:YbbR domain-containing protein